MLLYLNSRAECDKVRARLKESSTFAADADDELQNTLSVLAQIKNEPNQAPQVILTTNTSSFGINFFRACYVIMTEAPATLAEYQQIVGRSNRLDFKGVKRAALLTRDPYI